MPYVYILASRTKRLYIGVTRDIHERTRQHKSGEKPGFTARYNINKLVHYEEFDRITDAIEREKQLKGWLRTRKLDLIESLNPEWDDIAEHWY